jgi:hypothetical protein
MPEVVVIALDVGSPLTADQQEVCRALLDRAVHLVCGVIQTSIEQDIADRRVAGHPPSRSDLETLRRGRGPAALRNLLFECLDHWPDEVPSMAADVHRVLDHVLLRRAAWVQPTSVAGQTVALMEECRSVVQEYAANKGLDGRDADLLVSDVIDQLVRNAVRGELPRDLRAWTLDTAKWKWRGTRRLCERSNTSDHLSVVEPVARDHADDLEVRLVVTAWVHAVAIALSRFADRLAAIESDPATIVGHRVAAALLEQGDVDLVVAVIEGAPDGLRAIDYELTHRGQDLSRARRIAVQRLVRDALRQAWQRGQESGARESS